ncbi:hypothetical protein GQ44DRAFT_776767 [Phaeosphaeriaceae sp. PMI808]|nr:hypothetical protein GQ44DRAFT_776767 [Phaeosphaeriaceae sp. PMI808]
MPSQIKGTSTSSNSVSARTLIFAIDLYRLWRFKADREFNEVIAKVRSQPGFQNFLLPPAYNELMAAADQGPIVIVNGPSQLLAIELDMDIFLSQEALDTERAFYKDEIKYFVNAITKAIIERHLVEPLPDIILSPLVVTQMTEKEIEPVIAELPEITQQRLH